MSSLLNDPLLPEIKCHRFDILPIPAIVQNMVTQAAEDVCSGRVLCILALEMFTVVLQLVLSLTVDWSRSHHTMQL